MGQGGLIEPGLRLLASVLMAHCAILINQYKPLLLNGYPIRDFYLFILTYRFLICRILDAIATYLVSLYQVVMKFGPA